MDARGDDARPARSADHHRQLSHARRGAVRVRLRAGDGAHGLSDEPARRGAAARAPGPARDAARDAHARRLADAERPGAARGAGKHPGTGVLRRRRVGRARGVAAGALRAVAVFPRAGAALRDGDGVALGHPGDLRSGELRGHRGGGACAHAVQPFLLWLRRGRRLRSLCLLADARGEPREALRHLRRGAQRRGAVPVAGAVPGGRGARRWDLHGCRRGAAGADVPALPPPQERIRRRSRGVPVDAPGLPLRYGSARRTGAGVGALPARAGLAHGERDGPLGRPACEHGAHGRAVLLRRRDARAQVAAGAAAQPAGGGARVRAARARVRRREVRRVRLCRARAGRVGCDTGAAARQSGPQCGQLHRAGDD